MIIQIESIDENKSKPTATQPQYVANLTVKLDKTAINNLGSVKQQSRNAEILNFGINENPGNVLIFDTMPTADLATAVTTINGWLAQVTGSEDQFKQKIRDVNAELKAKRDKEKPQAAAG
jgi:hypothetical protein